MSLSKTAMKRARTSWRAPSATTCPYPSSIPTKRIRYAIKKYEKVAQTRISKNSKCCRKSQKKECGRACSFPIATPLPAHMTPIHVSLDVSPFPCHERRVSEKNTQLHCIHELKKMHSTHTVPTHSSTKRSTLPCRLQLARLLRLSCASVTVMTRAPPDACRVPSGDWTMTTTGPPGGGNPRPYDVHMSAIYVCMFRHVYVPRVL
jgi:hypothetical protein